MTESAKRVAASAAKSRSSLGHIAFRGLAILGFVGLIAIGAQMKVALSETAVPITLQTLFVLAAGAMLGPVDGMAAVAIYVALGVFGVPLFANPNAAGFAYLSGVTGGYLVGFVAAAFFVGALVRKTSRTFFQAGGFLAGAILILVFGTAWLAILRGSFERAFLGGFVPFVAGDVVKAALAFGFWRACGAAQRRMKRG